MAINQNSIPQDNVLNQTDRVIGFKEVAAKGAVVIDVRSPAEFDAGTYPGAINIPLFEEDERSVIGTIYRHGGREKAIDAGFEFVDKKIRELLEAFTLYRDVPLAVFCARGGMRSRSVVNLLNLSGYSAVQLEGGYKKYRHDVLDVLDSFRPNLVVIHGLTGTGKTRILQKLTETIDLEGLANHRSSLFGAFDREPSNQRSFESGLVQTISRLREEPYFIEGESRKIGKVFIPKPLAVAMKQGILVRVHCSLETRISRILEDYPVTDDKRRVELEDILVSLKQKMGNSKVEKMCDLLNSGQLHDLVEILLTEYYDKRYSRSMKNYSYVFEVSSENIEQAASALTDFRNELNRL